MITRKLELDAILLTLNVILLLLGTWLVTYALAEELIESNAIQEIRRQQYYFNIRTIPWWTAITCGSIVGILGSFGSIGVVLGNIHLHMIYSTVSLICLIPTIASSVYSVALYMNQERYINDELKVALALSKEKQKVRDFFDILHETLDCCGIESYSDLLQVLGYIPNTCCSTTNDADDCTIIQASETNGCLLRLANTIKLKISGILICFVITFIIQVSAIIMLRILSEFLQRNVMIQTRTTPSAATSRRLETQMESGTRNGTS